MTFLAPAYTYARRDSLPGPAKKASRVGHTGNQPMLGEGAPTAVPCLMPETLWIPGHHPTLTLPPPRNP